MAKCFYNPNQPDLGRQVDKVASGIVSKKIKSKAKSLQQISYKIQIFVAGNFHRKTKSTKSKKVEFYFLPPLKSELL